MVGEWPVCGAEATLFGEVMVCKLPKDHWMDGQEMHEDPDKCQWLITVTMPDGTVKRAC